MCYDNDCRDELLRQKLGGRKDRRNEQASGAAKTKLQLVLGATTGAGTRLRTTEVGCFAGTKSGASRAARRGSTGRAVPIGASRPPARQSGAETTAHSEDVTTTAVETNCCVAFATSPRKEVRRRAVQER
jgi:hypothetical protein